MTASAPRLAVAAAVLALVGAGAAPAAASSPPQVHFDLDNGETLKPGSVVKDDSGNGASGVVEIAYGGALRSVRGPGDTRAVRFPAPCTVEPCPNAMIRVSDRPGLDPGRAAFEWGATVKLAADETSKGANVLQKGLFNQVGGQWKLQVDGGAGFPSCILSGTRDDGSTARTIVVSTVSVANGRWRQVTCRRDAGALAVLIDGRVTGSAKEPTVKVSSSAPVTVGAKSVKAQQNDQFFGALDDVFMRLL